MSPEITYFQNGNIKSEKYLVNGVLHREDGPAYISYHENGNKKYEGYYINGEYHRIDGPAIIAYYINGNKQGESYYINGKNHRADDPAIIQYYENGNVNWELYCNYMHGDTSGISYYKDGMIETYVFILNGKLHKEDGPARIRYYQSGNISEEFYYKGELISVKSLNEYFEYVKERKLLEYFE